MKDMSEIAKAKSLFIKQYGNYPNINGIGIKYIKSSVDSVGIVVNVSEPAEKTFKLLPDSFMAFPVHKKNCRENNTL